MSTDLSDRNSLERYLSTQGVVSFSEHDSQGPEGAIVDECIAFASALFLGRLISRYPLSSLRRSPLSNEFCTVIAARTLCNRRGNPIPESTEMRYQEIIERDGLIDQIYKGTIKLVDANGSIIAGKGSNHPTMSNLRVDRRHINEKIRVKTQSSTPVNTDLERDVSHSWGGIIDG